MPCRQSAPNRQNPPLHSLPDPSLPGKRCRKCLKNLTASTLLYPSSQNRSKGEADNELHGQMLRMQSSSSGKQLASGIRSRKEQQDHLLAQLLPGLSTQNHGPTGSLEPGAGTGSGSAAGGPGSASSCWRMTSRKELMSKGLSRKAAAPDCRGSQSNAFKP